MMDTSRILQKGPEYLRKQMERDRESPGRSAAERLAATKPEHMRNQQQLSSETVCNLSFSDSSELTPGSPADLPEEDSKEVNVVKRNSSKKRPDSLLLYRQKGELQRGSPVLSSKKLLSKRTLLDSLKDKKEADSEATSGLLTEEANSSDGKDLTRKPRTDLECNASDTTASTRSDREDTGGKPRISVRNNQKDFPKTGTPIRNDQWDFPKTGTRIRNDQEDPAKPRTVTVHDREYVRKQGAAIRSEDMASKPTTTIVRSERSSRGNRVSRSHSDISSRYSRNFADFDTFFTYCGLDDDVIELVGRDNFCSRSEGSDEQPVSCGKVRSVSVVTSDDGFSQASSNRSEGLQEDKLPDKKPGQGPSVIERNARIIKWLYSCRNAGQSGKTLRDLD